MSRPRRWKIVQGRHGDRAILSDGRIIDLHDGEAQRLLACADVLWTDQNVVGAIQLCREDLVQPRTRSGRYA